MFNDPPVQTLNDRLANLTTFASGAVIPSPTVTVTPATTGSTHYSYVVVAHVGADILPTLLAITNGYASMSATNFNTVAWSPVNAPNSNVTVTYDVWRTVGGTTQGLIASGLVGAYQLVDTGIPATSGTAPVRNTTGTFVGNLQEPFGGIISATDASVIPVQPGFYVITATGAATPTLANPVAGTDDGIMITVTALTAHAHTITVPAGTLNGASATLTFAAVGDQAVLQAYNGYWVTNGVVTAAHIS
jgi:hypothetical protein